MAFVHLHNHTEFSSLDGLSRLKSVAKRAAALGQTAMAETEHGSLAGAWRFTKACKAAGIKPIIGIEIYMSIGDRFERNSEIVDRNDDTMGDADDSKGDTKEKRYEHLTLLARNEQGWKNLLALHNKAEESYWYKPRIDYKLLKEHGEGLIVLSGCLAGPVAGPLSRAAAAEAAAKAASDAEEDARQSGNDEMSFKLGYEAASHTGKAEKFATEARTNLDTLIDCVGKENVYLEIMYHGIEAENDVLKPIGALSREYGIPMVVTNDCHYEEEGDAGHHEGFLAVGSKKGLDDPARFKFNGGGYYVKSEQEMLDIKPGSKAWADACAMTQVIADRCDDQVIPTPHQRLPKYPLPEGFTDSNVYLKQLVKEGAIARYGSPLSQEVKDRLKTELDIIADMGFPDYFLIMWDVINWCRTDAPVEFDNPDASRKKPILVGPGRGSAAGSAVSYCLTIVGIDPLYNNLLFERFLEPGRAGMPDIDVDFEKGRRDEVFAYLGYRWGKGNVARIGTFGVALSKAAIKDAARILKPSGASAEVKAEAKVLFEAGERAKGAVLLRDAEKAAADRATHIMRLGNKMSDLVPASGEKAYDFAQLADPKDQAGQAFRDLVEESGQDAIDILEMARSFEGVIKNESIHACGFVVSPEPLDDLVPLRWASHAADADPAAPRVICWDGPEVEDYGFLKMDILGLMNLDIVSQALENIEMTTGETLTMDAIPHPDIDGDPKVDAAFALIAAGNTGGVFQMECISGETFVGGRSIKKLYEAQESGDPHERTRSYYLDSGETKFNKIKQIVKTGTKHTYRLITASGRMVEATSGHRFMTQESGWLELKDIVAGTSVLVDQKAKTRLHRRCKDCRTIVGSDPGNTNDRCYSCSARFHANPTHNREAIRAGIQRGYAEGRETWNKGLTADTSPVMASSTGRKISSALQGKTWEDMYGAEKASEMRVAASTQMSGKGNHMFGKPTKHAKGGFRADLGHYVRSSWEADYARVLIHLSEDYEYERHTFELTLDDGRVVTYTPDFFIPSRSRFVEVKGYMRPLDAAKIAKFLEVHPDYEFELVDPTLFAEYQMKYQDLVAWECPVMPARAMWEEVVEIIDAGVQDTFDIAMEGPAHNYLANGFMVHNSGGMVKIAQDVVPESLTDISAIVALFRPGPLAAKVPDRYAARKNGLEEVDYNQFTADKTEQEWIAKVLGDTYGVFVFQESLMRLGTVISGFDASQRSVLRKAVGKKDAKKMAEVGEMLAAGAEQEFFDEDGVMISPKFSTKTAAHMFELMKGSAQYLFNASHSAAYAQLAFVTAYLKANWPVEYAAAILAIADKDDKRMNAFWSLKTDGITVLAPDVNLSLARTAPVNGSVQMGLAEVKEVGAAGHYVVAEREKNGEFKDLHDVLTRVTVPGKNGGEPTKLPVGAIQGLIEAGALDSFGPRLGLLMTLRAAHKSDLLPIDAEWSDVEESTRQRQRLGVSLGTHPLQSLKDEIRAWEGPGGGRVNPLHKIADENGEAVLTVGVISMWEEKGYSGGRRANFALESSKVTVQGVMWDRTLSNLRRRNVVPKVGDVVAVSGKVNVRTTSVGDDESEAQDTITTKELSIFEVWPIASATAPQINEPPAVIDFAAKYRELRAANPDPKGPGGKEPDAEAPVEDTAPGDSVSAAVADMEEYRKKTRSRWVAVIAGSRHRGIGSGRVVAGDPAVKKSHLHAFWPVKKIQPGSIFRVMCPGNDMVTVLVSTPSLTAEQMLEIGKVEADDQRWTKQEGTDPLYTWYLLDQGAGTAAAESTDTLVA